MIKVGDIVKLVYGKDNYYIISVTEITPKIVKDHKPNKTYRGEVLKSSQYAYTIGYKEIGTFYLYDSCKKMSIDEYRMEML